MATLSELLDNDMDENSEDVKDVNMTEDDNEAVDEQVEDVNAEDGEFYENIAEYFDEENLNDLAYRVVEEFETNLESSRDFFDNLAKGYELLGINKIQEVKEPFPGASNAVNPIIMETAIKHAAKTVTETFSPKGVSRSVIYGPQDEMTMALANKRIKFVNWQYEEQIEEAYSVHEKVAFHRALTGNAYKKIIYDFNLKRPVHQFVPAQKVVQHYYSTDLKSSPSFTVIDTMSRSEVERLQKVGYFTDGVEVKYEGNLEESIDDTTQKVLTLLGFETAQLNDVALILEHHTFMDIGVEEDGEEDELLPYKIIVDYSSRKVLGIYREWLAEDENKSRVTDLVHYKYIEFSEGPYALGLFHTLGNTARSISTFQRAFLNAAMFSSAPTVLMSKSLSLASKKTNNSPVQPGEVRMVDTASEDIGKGIYVFQYPQPSQTFYQVFQDVKNEARQFADAGEQMINESQTYGGAATTLTLMEAANKMQTAINKRDHRALKEEFKILNRLNRWYFEDFKDVDQLSQIFQVNTELFIDTNYTVVPVSDPNYPTQAHRAAMTQMVMSIVAQVPAQAGSDPSALPRELLIDLGYDEDKIERIFPKPQQYQPQPQDPLTDITNVLQNLPIKAFEGQDHKAHVQFKTAFLMDPNSGGHPNFQQVAPLLQANIREHQLLDFAAQVKSQNPQSEAEMAFAAQDLAKKNQIVNQVQAQGGVQSPEQLLAQAQIMNEQNKAEANRLKEVKLEQDKAFKSVNAAKTINDIQLSQQEAGRKQAESKIKNASTLMSGIMKLFGQKDKNASGKN